jgi:signal transduction histidine kinase
MSEKKEKNTSDLRIMRASLGQTLLLALWLFLSVALVVVFLYLQRVDALELSLLAAVLLIPSVVVCIFLGHARFRIRREVERRYIEQIDHLAELEEKIRQRTRQLDERNRQLSAEVKERLAAEDSLKQSNDLLSGIIGSVDGIIYVVDFDSHEILFANEYLKRLFGFDPVGRKCYQFIHSSKDEPCMFCNNHKLLTDDRLPAEPYEWEYQNPFNKKWYRAKDQAIRWADGRYVKLEIAIDVTEQKSLQHFLQEARKQAELAIRIRSRFVALVAHDLKSPFYSITRMLKRILEREHFTHDIHRKFLENIVINGDRMLQMIDNLLSMNRLEMGGLKLEQSFFNVSEMANEVVQNFGHLAFEKGVRLVNSIPPTTEVYGDRYLYFVVLNNLVSNGIKFSDRGGRIELSTPEPERSMTVAVSDEGQGMSRQYAENLFRSDVKTSSPGTSGEKGSGLGLVFCQEIIKAHHGTIEVRSKPGVGTTFFVRLPECSNLDYKKNQQAQPAL